MLGSYSKKSHDNGFQSKLNQVVVCIMSKDFCTMKELRVQIYNNSWKKLRLYTTQPCFQSLLTLRNYGHKNPLLTSHYIIIKYLSEHFGTTWTISFGLTCSNSFREGLAKQWAAGQFCLLYYCCKYGQYLFEPCFTIQVKNGICKCEVCKL